MNGDSSRPCRGERKAGAGAVSKSLHLWPGANISPNATTSRTTPGWPSQHDTLRRQKSPFPSPDNHYRSHSIQSHTKTRVFRDRHIFSNCSVSAAIVNRQSIEEPSLSHQPRRRHGGGIGHLRHTEQRRIARRESNPGATAAPRCY